MFLDIFFKRRYVVKLCIRPFRFAERAGFLLLIDNDVIFLVRYLSYDKRHSITIKYGIGWRNIRD